MRVCTSEWRAWGLGPVYVVEVWQVFGVQCGVLGHSVLIEVCFNCSFDTDHSTYTHGKCHAYQYSVTIDATWRFGYEAADRAAHAPIP